MELNILHFNEICPKKGNNCQTVLSIPWYKIISAYRLRRKTKKMFSMDRQERLNIHENNKNSLHCKARPKVV